MQTVRPSAAKVRAMALPRPSPAPITRQTPGLVSLAISTPFEIRTRLGLEVRPGQWETPGRAGEYRLMKWEDLAEQRCSVARALSVIGDRWTLVVMRDCFLGVRRF